MQAVDPPEPAFLHLVHQFREPGQYREAVSGASLVADFVEPQVLPARVEQFQGPGWALDLLEAHVKARVHAALPPDWASLGLMRSSAPSSWYGIKADPGTLVCNPPGEPIDGCITPGFMCLSVGMPRDVWDRCRVLAGNRRSALNRFAAYQLPAPLYARIQANLLATLRLLRGAAGNADLVNFAVREASHFVSNIATAAWELSAPAGYPCDSMRNRARLARRAEEWMRDHLAEPIQVSGVCLALRVSRRELEYAFRSAFDQSPRNVLQTLRLNAIRRALQHCDGSRDMVTRVALDHGIMHLGRFAAHYRALFGESPSETRKHSSLR